MCLVLQPADQTQELKIIWNLTTLQDFIHISDIQTCKLKSDNFKYI
jgi:hypothetical protein